MLDISLYIPTLVLSLIAYLASTQTHTMKNQILKLALKWFKENDVIAYEIDGSIFVSTGEYDVQIADEDIKLRANLQTSK